MSDSNRMQYLFILNRTAGTTDAGDWETAIHDHFRQNHSTYAIHHLPEKIDVSGLKKYVLDQSPVNVIAVGGDGTITMLANILVDTDIHLGILPAGSANGMAKELGIPADPPKALEIIDRGYTRRIDLVDINNELCMHLSDIGLNAQLIKHFENGKLRGKWGYARVVLKTLWATEKMQVHVVAEKEELRCDAFMVGFANARTYGTGAVINPGGRTDDGLFEIIIVKKLNVGALLRMFVKPRLFNPKNIEIIPCCEAEIRTKRPMHFQVDGEYKGKETHIRARIRRQALSLIMPGDK